MNQERKALYTAPEAELVPVSLDQPVNQFQTNPIPDPEQPWD